MNGEVGGQTPSAKRLVRVSVVMSVNILAVSAFAGDSHLDTWWISADNDRVNQAIRCRISATTEARKLSVPVHREHNPTTYTLVQTGATWCLEMSSSPWTFLKPSDLVEKLADFVPQQFGVMFDDEEPVSFDAVFATTPSQLWHLTLPGSVVQRLNKGDFRSVTMWLPGEAREDGKEDDYESFVGLYTWNMDWTYDWAMGLCGGKEAQ